MTVTQIIDEIKMITPEERDQVSLFLTKCRAQNFSTPENHNELDPFCYANDFVVNNASEHILHHHAPLLKKLAL